MQTTVQNLLALVYLLQPKHRGTGQVEGSTFLDVHFWELEAGSSPERVNTFVKRSKESLCAPNGVLTRCGELCRSLKRDLATAGAQYLDSDELLGIAGGCLVCAVWLPPLISSTDKTFFLSFIALRRKGGYLSGKYGCPCQRSGEYWFSWNYNQSADLCLQQGEEVTRIYLEQRKLESELVRVSQRSGRRQEAGHQLTTSAFLLPKFGSSSREKNDTLRREYNKLSAQLSATLVHWQQSSLGQRQAVSKLVLNQGWRRH